MSSYYIKVKAADSTVNAEPEYWSRQIVSSAQSNLFWNLGSVGIGMASPLGKLIVDGNVGIGTQYSTIAPPANGLIVSGSLGVGTSAPTTKLHVVGDALITGNATLNALTLGTSTLASPTGSMPMFACRAWVNFDGTVTTGAWRAGGNIASVVRNSSGVYTITFSTAMTNTNYACMVTFEGSRAFLTVLNSLEGFLGVGQTMAGCQMTSMNLLKLAERVRMETALLPAERSTSGVLFLREVYASYEKALESAPNVLHRMRFIGKPRLPPISQSVSNLSGSPTGAMLSIAL